jgi:hypothetical protein
MIVGGLLLEVVLPMLPVEMALLVAQFLLLVKMVMLVEDAALVAKFDHISSQCCRANTNAISL